MTGKNIPEQWFELRFEGDPDLTEKEIKIEKAKGSFSQIQKLVKGEDGILRCKMDIKVKR